MAKPRLLTPPYTKGKTLFELLYPELMMGIALYKETITLFSITILENSKGNCSFQSDMFLYGN